MIGQRGSILFSIITNPLVWIGMFLGFSHLHTHINGNIWQTFQEKQTYINLLIGSTIYTALLDRHYTKNRERIAIMETLLAIIINAYIIFFVWAAIVFAVNEYHQSGLRYSITLKKRLEAEQAERNEETTPTVAPISEQLNLESNKRYKITPTSDGSFILEVIDD